MSEAQVKQEMAAIGLDWVRTEGYLPQQHVLIFKSQRQSLKALFQPTASDVRQWGGLDILALPSGYFLTY